MKTKLFILLTFLLVLSCSAVKQKSMRQKVFLKINTDKTYTNDIGAIMLYFDVVNNSNKEITILKPNNTADNRINYFANTMKCEDIPIWSTEYLARDIAVTENDYLLVKPKSREEILMDGRAFGWLACLSDSVKISIRYEPSNYITKAKKSQEPLTETQRNYLKVIHRISDMNIYSDTLVFKLNK